MGSTFRVSHICHAAIALGLGLCVVAAADARADFADGMKAFEAGDYETARSEFELLASADDHRGQFALGILYSRGAGVEKDEIAAGQYFEQAAANGHRAAPRRLGELYMGNDAIEAYKWYTVGVAVSCPASPKRRAQLSRTMTEGEIALANARAEQWLSAHAHVVDTAFQANFRAELERLQKTIAN